MFTDSYLPHQMILLLMAWTDSYVLDWNELIMLIIGTSADSSWHQVTAFISFIGS